MSKRIKAINYRRVLHKLDKAMTPDSPGYDFALVLLALAREQTISVRRIAKAVELPTARVAQIMYRYREAGIVQGNQFRPSEWAHTGDSISFWLDVLCGERFLKRVAA